MSAILLYCRAGFEKEAAAEIQDQARALGVDAYVKAQPGSAFLLLVPYEVSGAARLRGGLHFPSLCFARQVIHGVERIEGLPAQDRIAPLLDTLRRLPSRRYSDVFLETADTNEAKRLSVFVRQFSKPLKSALMQGGWLDPRAHAPRLHLFFLDSSTVYVGTTVAGEGAPWPMGIPRLRFPREAPSRSTLKLEEAFLTFLNHPEAALQPGMKAVDLGAAPGGWTYQLVRRGLRVTAVDNGPLHASLLASGLVEHLKVDGFRYRPKAPVDWLVCDMVEKPLRVADLVAQWAERGLTRRAIFNLKLPMKKRYAVFCQCRALIEERLNARGLRASLVFKQLYHDREEVTGYLRLGPEKG